jgi:hypothetical protein
MLGEWRFRIPDIFVLEAVCESSGNHDHYAGGGRVFVESSILVALAGRCGEHRAMLGSGPGWIRRRSADERRAFHEASHLVMAHLVGWHSSNVSIVPDEDTKVGSGHAGGVCVVHQGEPADHGPRRPAAEQETDEREAAKLAMLLGGPGWRGTLRTVRALRHKTSTLIDSSWPLVQRVTQALLRERTLDQAAIERILHAQEVAA